MRDFPAKRPVLAVPAVLALSALLLWPGAAWAQSQDLIGIDWDTGELFSIDPGTAAMTSIGLTGVTSCCALETTLDGTTYLFDSGSSSALSTVNVSTAVTTGVGPLGIGQVFEGALAFSFAGIPYGTNQGFASTPNLFTLDTTSGSASIVGTMGTSHDINGLAWRGDGMLVGMDRITNSLMLIDPGTASISLLAPLTPTVGTVGGMAVLDGTAYFNTSGPAGSFPGSNELWTVDLYTGLHSLVGSFAGTVSGTGISGLAVERGCGFPATTFFCNAGTNPASYTASTLPSLGGTYVGSVDLAGTTGHNLALLVGYFTPLSLLLTGGQTLLVNIADPDGELLAQALTPGPTADFSIPIPGDPALCGIRLSTQALHLGGVTPFALSNAQDLGLGL